MLSGEEMNRFRVMVLSVMTASLVTACAVPEFTAISAPSGRVSAHKAGVSSDILVELPAALSRDVQPQAQLLADEASKRRGIDYFNLHSNPIGMRIGDAYVLSFLGTSKERTELNIEMRAFYTPQQLDFGYNYSGPVTLAGRQAPIAPFFKPKSAALSFELIFGLPGNGVAEAYGDYLDALAGALKQRYQAKPFNFDDTPTVLAVKQNGEALAFLFTNQGNRLVLGDRKYADVQSVALFSTDAMMLNAYTLVGFNQKTPSPSSAPTYDYQQLRGLGLLAQFGELSP